MRHDRDVEEQFRLAAAGDRDAFARLVEQHQAMVFSIAGNFIQNQATAEELAQEVFLELYRALPSLESGSHVTNWLRRVTAHRSIDQARREKFRRTVLLDEVDESSLRHSAGTGMSEDLFLSARLRSITASLPEHARAVVVLRYQEDMPPAEIAQVLGMPIASVKSHLHRSLTILRHKLERIRVKL